MKFPFINTLKKLSLISAFCLAISFLTACDKRDDDSVWIVGTSADNPPYEYMENGEIVGFDIDLVTAIGAHLGKEIEIKNMDFHGLLAALNSGSVDMVIAGLSVTTERKERVDFSMPYTKANIAILYRTSSGFAKLEDLQGKIVGAQLGTIWSYIANQMAVAHKSKVSALSSNLMLVEELKTKRIDAMVLEISQAEQFSAKNKMLSFFPVKEYGSAFAIAIPKQSGLKNNIDHTIKLLRNKGTIQKLEQKWGLAGVPQ